jgi:hypothetical protein
LLIYATQDPENYEKLINMNNEESFKLITTGAFDFKGKAWEGVP